MMNKNSDKTERTDKPAYKSPHEKKFGFSTTVEIHTKTFIDEISTKQQAFLEISSSGEKKERLELGEGKVFIGRAPECEIRLSINNVSRKHASITFTNEEYHIKDLGSTNGVYINGIKVEKCILRNFDQIDIGGVKILFGEEKIR